MNFLNCLLDVTEESLTWDIPEEGFAETIKNQACLMAGIHPEEMSQFPSD
ncbi:MAG: hypothetical protein ACR65R_16635 [Methylomicrobium sp.]